jgi:hypothetical protein
MTSQLTTYDNAELDSTFSMTDFAGSSSRHQRSTEMHTMYEALAREHLRELYSDARKRSLYRELAAARKPRQRPRSKPWRRSRRSSRAASLSAVAD